MARLQDSSRRGSRSERTARPSPRLLGLALSGAKLAQEESASGSGVPAPMHGGRALETSREPSWWGERPREPFRRLALARGDARSTSMIPICSLRTAEAIHEPRGGSAGFQPAVSRICHPLSLGQPPTPPLPPHALPNAIRRYRRLKICATSWLRCLAAMPGAVLPLIPDFRRLGAAGKPPVRLGATLDRPEEGGVGLFPRSEVTIQTFPRSYAKSEVTIQTFGWSYAILHTHEMTFVWPFPISEGRAGAFPRPVGQERAADCPPSRRRAGPTSRKGGPA